MTVSGELGLLLGGTRASSLERWQADCSWGRAGSSSRLAEGPRIRERKQIGSLERINPICEANESFANVTHVNGCEPAIYMNYTCVKTSFAARLEFIRSNLSIFLLMYPGSGAGARIGVCRSGTASVIGHRPAADRQRNRSRRPRHGAAAPAPAPRPERTEVAAQHRARRSPAAAGR